MMCDDRKVDQEKIQATPEFRIYPGSDLIPSVTFYFVERTAPDNVEERTNSDGEAPRGLSLVDRVKEVVFEIAHALVPEDKPEAEADLVVMVHGFNTPRDMARDGETFYGRFASEARAA
jgi:hypothetical protein